MQIRIINNTDSLTYLQYLQDKIKIRKNSTGFKEMEMM